MAERNEPQPHPEAPASEPHRAAALTPLSLVATFLGIAVLVGGGVWYYFTRVNAAEEKAKAAKWEAYLADQVAQSARDLRSPSPEVVASALGRLAGSRDEDDLGPRLVAQALQTEADTHELRRCGEGVLIAAVGLSLDRRARVEQLLRDRLADKNLPEARRLDVAVLAGGLGGLSPETARLAAALLAAEAGRPDNFPRGVVRPERQQLAEQLAAVARDLPPSEAFDVLLQVLAETTDEAAWTSLARALCVAAERLPTGDSEKARTRAADAVLLSGEWVSRNPWPLLALVKPLPPAAAGRLLAVATARSSEFRNAVSEHGRAALGVELSRVVRRLAGEELVPFAEAFAQALVKATNNGGRALVERIPDLASRLTPEQATRILDEYARPADEAKATEWALLIWADWLDQLGPLLSEDEAGHRYAKAARAINAALRRPENAARTREDVVRAGYLAAALRTVAGRMRSREAGPAFLALVDTNSKAPLPSGSLPGSPAKFADRLDPDACRALARTLADQLAVATEPRDVFALTDGLAAVSDRIPPADVAKVAQAIVTAYQTMTDKKVQDDSAVTQLMWHVENFAERAPAVLAAVGKEAPNVLAALIRSRSSSYLIRDLYKSVPKLDPDQKAVMAESAVRAIEGASDTITLNELITVLKMFTSGVTDRDAAPLYRRATVASLAILEKNLGEQVLWYNDSLNLIRRLPPEESAATQAKFAGLLARRIRSGQGLTRDHVRDAAEDLVEIAERLASRDIDKQCADAVGDLIGLLPAASLDAVGGLVAAVGTLAGRLTDDDDARALGRLREVRSPGRLWAEDDLSPAVAAFLARKDFDKAVDFLDQALLKAEKDEGRLSHRASGYVVLARLAPDPDKTADLYLRMRQAAEYRSAVRSALNKALPILARRLPKEKATEVVTAALADRRRFEDCWGLVEAFKELTGKAPPEPEPKPEPPESEPWPRLSPVQRRAVTVATAAGLAGEPLAGLATAWPALKPEGGWLTTAQLVARLKTPTRVGKERRAALDQLELLHARPFVDVWAFVRFAEGAGIDLAGPPAAEP